MRNRLHGLGVEMAEALAEYEACLKLNPNRFNSLFGAGRAAEQAGKADVARRYYEQLVATTAKDTPRPELAQVRAYLAKP